MKSIQYFYQLKLNLIYKKKKSKEIEQIINLHIQNSKYK